jgi:hypothetical protein
LAENVSALVLFLASSSCSSTGETYLAAFGRYARVFIGVSSGWAAPDARRVSPEDVKHHLAEVMSLDDFTIPRDVHDSTLTSAYVLGLLEPAELAVERFHTC